ELLRRLRTRPALAETRIFAVLDLHGNVSPAMAAHADALVAYRENPHTDAGETGFRAAELLRRSFGEGRRTRTYWRRPHIVWPPPGTGTAETPMRQLEAEARRIEREDPRVAAVNVMAGFSFADTPFTGVSFSLVGILPESDAHAHLAGLCRIAWQHRAAGHVLLPQAEEVLQRILPVER